MLVSAPVTEELRVAVQAGECPKPEYMYLESDHGVELLDWTRIGLASGHRSIGRSLKHAAVAVRIASCRDAVLSDGEHVGMPLAGAMRLLRREVPHVMIGHHLLTPAKLRALRFRVATGGIDRVVVHSQNQVDAVRAACNNRETRVVVVPYGVDTVFWNGPSAGEVGGLVASAGREHRDYATLVSALPVGARLTIADHSPFTPAATRIDPPAWPAEVERVALPPTELRELYRRAQVVVVPVMRSTMPAGITTLLEAMSMGKAVVVTETEELRGVVEHGRTGLTVAPGDAVGLRRAIERLLGDAHLRRSLGASARRVAVERHDSKLFADALFAEMSCAFESRRAGYGGDGTRR